MEADLVDQMLNSTERRLARTLLILSNLQSNTGLPSTPIHFNQTAAEIVGCNRSRLHFFMNGFRKLGFISYNGHIEVHASLLNVVLHDHPHIAADKPSRKPSNGL